MFELRGVSKRFGDLLALAPTDLFVPPGKTVVLIGPSGSGKSTLLRLMVGLLRPDTGEVCFGGMELTPGDAQALRRRMGFVVQGGGLFPHLSANENATIMAQYLDWEPSRIQGRLDLLVELTRFPVDRLSKYPIELSGGERQRVSLIRALMLDPDVLLLDEPLGALDPMTRFELQTDLRRIFGQLRKTVVLVTHDLSEAAFFADQIVLLRAGRVVQRGPLDELVRSPADSFVTQFINAQRPPVALTSHGQ
jgi:osmoprotectant transport system ATP-binding protein